VACSSQQSCQRARCHSSRARCSRVKQRHIIGSPQCTQGYDFDSRPAVTRMTIPPFS
jgi:hypothetical protein